MKAWQEVYTDAKTLYAKYRCCPVCNGLAYQGETPGPEGKGSGSTFVRNAEMLKKIFTTVDAISDNTEIDTTSEFFGRRASFPVYAAPISGILQNYGTELDDMSYTKALVDDCRRAGTLVFTGGGMHDEAFKGPVSVVAQHEGFDVPTIKPWSREHMAWRIELTEEGHMLVIASNIDASGLTSLRISITPVGFKNIEELKEIMRIRGGVPFILRGILSMKGVCRALGARASGITVSNHSGRVLDDCLSGIEVLEDIVRVIDRRMKVSVSGAFRTGNDVFKVLALGADGVLIGRPVSQAVIGGGSDGLVICLEKIRLELKEAMAMADCKTVQDIARDCVSVTF